MPRDLLAHQLSDRVADLNSNYSDKSAAEVLAGALETPLTGRLALVSSFGAESVVLLHMLAQIDKGTPVLFIDTQMLFYETMKYQADLTEHLGLWNVRIIRPDEHEVAARDPHGTLHKTDVEACCALRKARPLHAALDGFDGWITGRKRFQSGTRAKLAFFEAETGTGRIKINPLAHWTPLDIRSYMSDNDLPKHPMVEKGYPSIGCAPCTNAVTDGSDPRSGRWQGQQKTECGIHFDNGKLQRNGFAS